MQLVAVFFFASFLGTLILEPALIHRLRRQGFVVQDMYKPGERTMVTHLGLLELAVAVFALGVTLVLRPPALLPFAYRAQPINPMLAAQLGLFTICGYGIIGAIDDRRSLSHLVKAAVPLTLGIPAAVVALSRPEATTLLERIPALAPLTIPLLSVVVPVYILVVTNFINMHSGFNGLQSGLALILLSTLIVRFWLDGTLDASLVLIVVAGSVAAFYPFNRYPARAIEGNVGSFLVGATIGVGIATRGLFLAGAIMLAPHILDFMLFLYTKLSRRPFIKFGRIREDGTIEAPYPFKLKFLLPYYLHLTERQTVYLLYALTVFACGVSLLVNA